MSEILQWIIVVLIVGVAVIYICRRFALKKQGAECCCKSCPLGSDYAEKCNKRPPSSGCSGRI